jgi:RNA polymerase sigma-70 factor (ECF subfamily)
LSTDLGPGFTQTADLGRPDTEHLFVEPWADEPDDAGDPDAAYARREEVELAYVAALQHLPGSQRAVLLLREVLQFSAAEVAELLDTSVASVNSALQRGRATMAARAHGRSQQAELAALGEDGVRRLVEEFVAAWEAADVDRISALLAEDAQFTMPPLPAWFDGREMVLRFMAERLFETPWRLSPRTVNGQPGLYCEQLVDGDWRPGAVNVLSVRDGRISWIAGFVDPEVVRNFS